MIEYEKLKRYIVTKVALDVLEEELEQSYYPISSPNGKEVIGGKSSVRLSGNPTEQALDRISRLQSKISEYKALITDVDSFIDTLEDPYIQTICHLHYRKGNSWADTAYKIYGNYNSETVRSAVKRYFKRGK